MSNKKKEVDPVLSELGKRLAAARGIKTANCDYCGQEFTGYNKRRFCSEKCRVAAHRAAKRDAEKGVIYSVDKAK